MPSGNAIYTYTGPDPEITIQGQTFTKDEPKHLTDQGVIAVCKGRGDFVSGKKMTGFLSTLTDEQRKQAMEYSGDDAIAPAPTAKPKKAAGK